MPTILIVDDEPTQLLLLQHMLEKDTGLDVLTATNGEEALALFQSHQDDIELVLTDLTMPILDGKALLKQIHKTHPLLPVIVLTGTDEVSAVVEIMKLGAADFITKPFERERLHVSVQNALKHEHLSREVSQLRRQLTGEVKLADIVGIYNGLKQAASLAQKATTSSLTVLLEGESGTGKELFARAIHFESSRADAPFVALNCGAIPENLAESVLFGHEKGSFTGATKSQLGKFREAEGGTLFLDEVGELPPEMQVKLLRALQNSEIEPVGLGRALKVNVRIIAATNRNLQQAVLDGAFREDLYYRLNSFPITLPPLRERMEDLPALIQHMLEKMAQDNTACTLDEAAHSMLLSHSWPGNVRELENTLARAALLADNHIIEAEHVQLSQSLGQGKQGPKAGPAIALFNSHGTFKRYDEIYDELIEHALAFTQGNYQQAAALLGISHATLYRRRPPQGSSKQ